MEREKIDIGIILFYSLYSPIEQDLKLRYIINLHDVLNV